MRKKVIAGIAAALALALGGAALAYVIIRDTPEGQLDTELAGVTLVRSRRLSPRRPSRRRRRPSRQRCRHRRWSHRRPRRRRRPPSPRSPPRARAGRSSAASPQRTLARADIQLGMPKRRPLWVTRDGQLHGVSAELLRRRPLREHVRRAHRRRRRRHGQGPSGVAGGGPKASTPRDRRGLDRRQLARRLRDRARRRERTRRCGGSRRARRSSRRRSPSTGRCTSARPTDACSPSTSQTGRVRWAYDTGGRINSSPSIWGDRICITTYAGSIFCLDRRDGTKLWNTYVSRDAFRYESFYASASTDGERLYTVARTGKVVALDAATGDVVWTQNVGALAYSTPAIADGRVFVGGFDGALHAYARTRAPSSGERTSAAGSSARRSSSATSSSSRRSRRRPTPSESRRRGRLAARARQVRTGIATDERYYLSLNGLLHRIRGHGDGP